MHGGKDEAVDASGDQQEGPAGQPLCHHVPNAVIHDTAEEDLFLDDVDAGPEEEVVEEGGCGRHHCHVHDHGVAPLPAVDERHEVEQAGKGEHGEAGDETDGDGVEPLLHSLGELSDRHVPAREVLLDILVHAPHEEAEEVKHFALLWLVGVTY